MDLVLLVIGLCGVILTGVFVSTYLLNRLAQRNEARAQLASNNRGAAH